MGKTKRYGDLYVVKKVGRCMYEESLGAWAGNT